MPTVHLPTRGINMNFHAFGHGHEHIVLVNGFTMTYHGWSRQIEFFSQQEHARKYTVLVFDNRGVGRSSPITGPCNISTLAMDVLSLLSELQWQTFHLVGISMGGMISLEMAARAPERLRSLVIMNTHAGGLGALPPLPGIKGVFAGLLDPANSSAGDRTNFGTAVFNDSSARLRLNKAAMDSWLRLRDIPRNLNVGSALTHVPESRGPKPARISPSTFFWQGLGTILHYVSKVRLEAIRDARIPTTIVKSSDDTLVRPSNSEGIFQTLDAPWVRLCTFEAGGHAIIMEAASEINDLLLNHLQAVHASSANDECKDNFRWPNKTPQVTVTSSVGTVRMVSKL
eukprot:TRINITY_DN25997_c0_g1_i1.p1 TRINITY_DN25997_c0_g1~~TRINITY_DN25997_c0_g1_i1.p1  ORF type:complete len:342 (+),score=17.29 TRINITY_DN25997_c0_g1_i1:140-1165(+)